MTAPAPAHPQPHPTGIGEVVEKGKIKLPLWAWAVIGGVVIGGGYWFYKKRQAAAAAANSASGTTTTASSAGYTDPTTILPMFQGDVVSEQQFQDLYNQVQQLASPATPTKPYTVTAQQISGNWDSNAIGLATIVYGLKDPTEQDATLGAAQIVEANPQINWAQPLSKGTTVNIPRRFIAQMYMKAPTDYNQG